MKCKRLPLRALLLAFLMAATQSCQDLWDEHCLYTGYLQGHLELTDSTLHPEDFRLAYYPQSGKGMGLLDGVWDAYGKEGIAGRLVNIGEYRVLSYAPGDFELRDTADLDAMTLAARHGWDAGTGLELITASTRPAASDWGHGLVDVDDTARVWMKPRLLTQHLRISVHLLNVPEGSDFCPVRCLLAGVASEKRLLDRKLAGTYLHAQARFREAGEAYYHADMDLLGTAGATDHLLRLICQSGGTEHVFTCDLAEELHSWQSPYREVTISLKVGERMELSELLLLGWIDKDQGDFPLLNE